MTTHRRRLRTGNRRSTGRAKRLAVRRALCVTALVLGATGCSRFGVVSMSSEKAHRLLDDALGYALVYNYKQAEALGDRVLARTRVPHLRARAHWVKALAYAKFRLEYRTDKPADKLAAEKKTLARLAPELLDEQLARWEVIEAFRASGAGDVDRTLNELRRALLKSGAPDNSPPPREEDRLTDPASVYRLAVAYWTAVPRKKLVSEEDARGYNARAAALFKRAFELDPQNYEYGAYCATALAEMGQTEEAQAVAKRLVDQLDGKRLYPLSDDQGPFCLYAATVALSDAAGARALIRERASRPTADPWVHFREAGYRENETTSATEKTRIWEGFVRRLETGEIPMRGSDLPVLARACYRLAHLQSLEGYYGEALDTCEKLAALSPHYAELHNNRGAIYSFVALRTEKPREAKRLLELARKEFELQLQYDWHGRAAADARRRLEELGP